MSDLGAYNTQPISNLGHIPDPKDKIGNQVIASLSKESQPTRGGYLDPKMGANGLSEKHLFDNDRQ